MYQLTSTNMSNAGGPMGGASTYDNWTKFFTTVQRAKKYAEKDYLKQCTKDMTPQVIKWENDKDTDYICSQDLLFVMYYIETVEVEK
ncbi:hypothetical protein ACFLQL_00455 [Verrucomicrobiota bacterium]